MYNILFLDFLIFFSEITILEPFSIASGIKSLPSILLPLIAKKISFFFTLELSKAIPEKKLFILSLENFQSREIK